MKKRRLYKPRPERIPNEYRSLDELPELMTVYDVADVLHISVASAYATLLYDAGVDVKSAQRYLGHANLVLTLKVYTHLTKYKEGKSMENYNKMLEEKGLIEQAVNR